MSAVRAAPLESTLIDSAHQPHVATWHPRRRRRRQACAPVNVSTPLEVSLGEFRIRRVDMSSSMADGPPACRWPSGESGPAVDDLEFIGAGIEALVAHLERRVEQTSPGRARLCVPWDAPRSDERRGAELRIGRVPGWTPPGRQRGPQASSRNSLSSSGAPPVGQGPSAAARGVAQSS